MKKCNVNYQSQYAVIDNVDIHVNEYIKIKYKDSKPNIKCKNGHQLVCGNGLKNRPYFRHKNSCDLDPLSAILVILFFVIFKKAPLSLILARRLSKSLTVIPS